jgi:antirestriction protein ArdC
MRRNVGRKPQTSANLAAFLHIIDTSRLLAVLRKDSRAIMTAAAKAEAAAAFLLRATDLATSDEAKEQIREAA